MDKVFIIYNEFKSVLQQRVVIEQLMPVSRTTEEVEEEAAPAAVDLTDYIYEQPPAELFSQLLPRLVETQIYRALLSPWLPSTARA